MSRVLRFLAGLTATLLLIGALAVAACMAWAHYTGAFDPIVLQVDGETIDLGDGLSAGGAIAGMVAIGVALLVALAIALLAVPLVVLLPLLAVALPLVLVLLVATSAIAIVLSPLLLVVWLLWRLARGPSRDTRPATMAR